MNTPAGAAPVQHTDAVIIGAGPVGLWQAFQLGLQEIRCHLVDSLPAPGGQCIELYPDKPIYDIPGLPRCSGRELSALLQQQIAPFAPPLHLGQEVASLQPLPEAEAEAEGGGFELTTSAGLTLRCRLVFIAGGAGSFQPRSLKVPGLEAFAGSPQLLHHWPADTTALQGREVVVAGGEELALGWALALLALPAPPARVTLLHRRDVFQGEPQTLARFEAARAAGRLQVVAGQPVGVRAAEGRLRALEIATPAGSTEPLPLDVLLVGLGLSPRLGPIADWGLAMARKQVVVDAERFETSVAGIYAVGDINHYPGKKKLIVCGFHEATLAAFAAAARLHAGPPGPLEYTTSSSRLQRLLGVAPPR